MSEIMCLCPTYGRFHALRDSVAWYLLQSCTVKRLLICNDGRPIHLHPKAIRVGEFEIYQGIFLWNVKERFSTLGEKRQKMLEKASSPQVAHWDDDDIYLPWHLDSVLSMLRSTEAGAVKPKRAWWAVGGRENFKLKVPAANAFESQMAFNRRAALAVGYPNIQSGQALELWKKIDSKVEFDNAPYWNMVYRWGDGLSHVSSAKSKFHERNSDWGEGFLLPGGIEPAEWARSHLMPVIEHLAEEFYRLKGEEVGGLIVRRLELAIRLPLTC